ncbi:MAG TPA: hypothetical protein PKD00_01740 [Burkholderiales bacterium]|nr:hypothetical protein [Burkholderiales bacterium]
MACNCIKDFGYNISYDTCKKIIYQDATVWVEEPSTYEISITSPASNTPVTLTVPTTGVLVITSGMLGLTEDTNLPSGIYCVTVVNCNGDVIQKDFINLCTYECQLANLIAVIDLTACNEENVAEEIAFYTFIKMLIEGAKAKFDCDWCSVKELKELLLYIKKKLDKHNCTCK